MARARIVLTAVLSAGIWMQGALAHDSSGPAELPPDTFAGRQYIDSTGCAYVRGDDAAQGGWVARLSGDGAPLCGFVPTFPDTVTSATPQVEEEAPVAPPGPAPAPRLGTTPRADASPFAAPESIDAPPAAPETRLGDAPALPTAPAAVGQRQSDAPPASAQPDLIAPGIPSDAPPAVVAAVPPAPVDALASDDDAVTTVATPLPKVAPAAPRGHAKGSTPRRTPQGMTMQQACEGRSGIQPGLVSLRTGLPIDCGTGAATGTAPDLLTGARPTTMAAICADILATGRRYIRAGTGTEVTCAPTVPDTKAQGQGQAQTAPSGHARTTQAAALTQHRFVQVGAFSNPANAKRSAQRLVALGLPTQQGRMQRDGKELRVVVAGPFDDTAALNAALATVRRGGFADAFTRR